MDATEFNTKYNRILSGFGLLRVQQATAKKWKMQTKDRREESCRLFLYLRTMIRHVPGINITDCEFDVLYTKALKLINELSLPFEGVLAFIDKYPEQNCGCGGCTNIYETINNISTSNKPSPESIFYDDSRWNDDHTLLSEPAWDGFLFKVMSNTDNRFLGSGDGFTVLGGGGFSITNPMYEGQEFIPIF